MVTQTPDPRTAAGRARLRAQIAASWTHLERCRDQWHAAIRSQVPDDIAAARDAYDRAAAEELRLGRALYSYPRPRWQRP